MWLRVEQQSGVRPRWRRPQRLVASEPLQLILGLRCRSHALLLGNDVFVGSGLAVTRLRICQIALRRSRQRLAARDLDGI